MKDKNDSKKIDDCPVISVDAFSVFYDKFCFLDTGDSMAKNLFADEGIQVKILGEFVSEKSPYIFVLCKCRKRDREKFLEAIRKLPDKAMLLGYKDYTETFEQIFD